MNSNERLWEKFERCLLFGFPKSMMEHEVKYLKQAHTRTFDKIYESLVTWKMYTAKSHERVLRLQMILKNTLPQGAEKTIETIYEVIRQYEQQKNTGINAYLILSRLSNHSLN